MAARFAMVRINCKAGEVYSCRPTPKEPYSDNVHKAQPAEGWSGPSLDKYKLVGFWHMPLPKSPGELGFENVCVVGRTV